ncbi:MAG: glutamine--fructose-6-phosphate transaminase (isomerizing) [Planctomycetaceae bacterium]|jgi:glucosamine--fructose-6-phosphate aminotransferase (isomerizing)|nr:glutamine--fructose-6-phosphate transaminase (isomerizing) [Planctomycetaceae bacterium]
MCGIVGYIGFQEASDFLIAGLQRLEYRGYDSAGIATFDEDAAVRVAKTVGRVKSLETMIRDGQTPGKTGIGHTRWATHGAPSVENSHPHFGGDAKSPDVAVVHNGVIENHHALRSMLEAEGCVFSSQTDTETIAHLLSRNLKKMYAKYGRVSPGEMTVYQYAPLIEVLHNTLSSLQGTYGLAIMFRDFPEILCGARLGSPLTLGVGDGENFIASDPSPFVGYANRIVTLADHEIAILSRNDFRVIHRDQGQINPTVKELAVAENGVDLGGFPHYMLKEIFEQPESLRNTLRGRLDYDAATAHFGVLRQITPQQLRQIDRILLTGCGTSWHAALVGEYQMEAFARIPVEVEYASELRYRNPPIDANSLLFAITQSGETADTLAALREMKRKGILSLSICNIVGSTIAQASDGGIYLHAGPEVGVASTKAFTSQCLALGLLALYFGRIRHISFEAGLRIIKAFDELPDKAEQTLAVNSRIREIAEKYADSHDFLFLGRQYNFPTALEGALKLKEISYIHAEGYPAAEMKHGPIALVDKNMPSVFIVPRDAVYDKVLSNIQEIKARGGPVIAVVESGDKTIESLADDIIEIPHTDDFLQPIIASIPLQLLAYHIAIFRGCDVDRPRNLAKSVTVE